MSNDLYAQIGRRVKIERTARHFTQQELADAAGTDPAHISRIENGKTVPSIVLIKKLADALTLPIADLFRDVPRRQLPDYGYAGKMGELVKDIPPNKRDKVLRLLKTIAASDD